MDCKVYFPFSTIMPLRVAARQKTHTDLRKIYNLNCNLSPVILALSSVSAPSEQYKLILTKTFLFQRPMFTTDREHHGQLILNYFTQNVSEYGHEYHNHTLQTSS